MWTWEPKTTLSLTWFSFLIIIIMENGNCSNPNNTNDVPPWYRSLLEGSIQERVPRPVYRDQPIQTHTQGKPKSKKTTETTDKRKLIMWSSETCIYEDTAHYLSMIQPLLGLMHLRIDFIPIHSTYFDNYHKLISSTLWTSENYFIWNCLVEINFWVLRRRLS